MESAGGDRRAARTMSLMRRLHTTFSDDRGDVPGWVLITLMTAGLSNTPLIACRECGDEDAEVIASLEALAVLRELEALEERMRT